MGRTPLICFEHYASCCHRTHDTVNAWDTELFHAKFIYTCIYCCFDDRITLNFVNSAEFSLTTSFLFILHGITDNLIFVYCTNNAHVAKNKCNSVNFYYITPSALMYIQLQTANNITETESNTNCLLNLF